MATAVIAPKLGNSVESLIIVEWRKAVGEQVAQGEPICDVETDKATMEMESPASGTLLAQFYRAGDEVPVLANIAAIGEPGEDYRDLQPGGEEATPPGPAPGGQAEASMAPPEAPRAAPAEERGQVGISPRARHLAERKGLDASTLAGSGPQGRVIERDVQAALAAQPKFSPVAEAMLREGSYQAPASGSGPGGRVMARDLVRAEQPAGEEDVEIIPLKGVRKVIAQRMLDSLQTTAQLTLNASADARSLTAYRQRLKDSPEDWGLQRVSINDLVLLAVARTLPHFPDLNALFTGDQVARYRHVHLGVAVDTPRGLMVPVVRNADSLSLKALSQEAKRLATACLEGKVAPDELTGGTFTVTNLGSLGIESFTPVLNPPQVGILGVGNINLKPVMADGEVAFVPHLGLSLTINHQVVDGAPAARFLQALSQALAAIDLLPAV